jgi:hypothetical protein
MFQHHQLQYNSDRSLCKIVLLLQGYAKNCLIKENSKGEEGFKLVNLKKFSVIC